MNLIQIGARTYNLDLVVMYEDAASDPDPAGPGGDLKAILAFGGALTFAGAEASLVRKFLADHARRLPEDLDGDRVFTSGPPLPGGGADPPVRVAHGAE